MSEQFENNNVDVELTTDPVAEEPVAELRTYPDAYG